MRLFEYDTYSSISRFIDASEPLVAIDVGANIGETARSLLGRFPKATVHAFEPAPSTFAKLCRTVAGDPRIHPVRLAAGNRSGTVEFHITENDWCSSVLPPSDLGRTYYGDWYATRQKVEVPIVRLDDWAKREGITRVDFLKVDAQGYDLEVLRGATELLHSGVRALQCECQFAPEYEGCSTFSQIDQFLVTQGFALHQIHEMSIKGPEQQTSYCDALWLRTDVLAALRSREDLPDSSPLGRVAAALRGCVQRGRQRIALYGAGTHTRWLAKHFDGPLASVRLLIDDNPALRGTRIGRCPVIPQAEALAAGIDAVILSSDAHEPALWANSEPLRRAGIEIIPLYGRYPATAPIAA